MSFKEYTIDDVVGALLDGGEISRAGDNCFIGGGAIAGLTAALAASLGVMALKISGAIISNDGATSPGCKFAASLQHFQETAFKLADADGIAFMKVREAWKISKDNPEREGQVRIALFEAEDTARRIMDLSHDILALLQQCVRCVKPSLFSDLIAAALLAETTARIAELNIDKGNSAEILQQCRDCVAKIERDCLG